MNEVLIFSIISIVGLALVIAGIFFDDVFDFSDISVTIVGAFLSLSGAFALILMNASENRFFVYSTSFSMAFINSFLVNQLIKSFKKSNSSEMNNFKKADSLIGKQVKILWWKENKGEVLVSFAGNLERRMAESKEIFTIEDSAVIKEIQSNKVLILTKKEEGKDNG